MKARFDIFGQPVELKVTSDQTGGAFSVGRQTCQPGAGTPPHMHLHEDEVFSVISGRFEFFNGTAWIEIPEGETVLARRGGVHCFRNCGDTEGVIQFVCSGAGFDVFLEGLARFSLPDDVQAIVDYSFGYGITYPTLPPPTMHAAKVEATQHEVLSRS